MSVHIINIELVSDFLHISCLFISARSSSSLSLMARLILTILDSTFCFSLENPLSLKNSLAASRARSDFPLTCGGTRSGEGDEERVSGALGGCLCFLRGLLLACLGETEQEEGAEWDVWSRDWTSNCSGTLGLPFGSPPRSSELLLPTALCLPESASCRRSWGGRSDSSTELPSKLPSASSSLKKSVGFFLLESLRSNSSSSLWMSR